MNSYDFSDRVAVVTGGAQGIGLATARRLADSGARLAIWDMDLDRARTASKALGGIACHVDVSDWASVQAAANRTRTDLGPPDIVVNSAGIAGPNAPVSEYDIEAWNRIIAVNLTGTFLVNKAVIPDMIQKNYGRIVNIASIAGKEGNPKASAYSASKAGVIGFTKSLGKELASHDISVNCITPAAARTPIFEQMTDEFIAYMLSRIPRGRFVEVEEIVNLICWLVSEENSFTTGAVFDISGGRATY